jgi:hypothetical protein
MSSEEWAKRFLRLACYSPQGHSRASWPRDGSGDIAARSANPDGRANLLIACSEAIPVPVSVSWRTARTCLLSRYFAVMSLRSSFGFDDLI